MDFCLSGTKSNREVSVRRGSTVLHYSLCGNSFAMKPNLGCLFELQMFTTIDRLHLHATDTTSVNLFSHHLYTL